MGRTLGAALTKHRPLGAAEAYSLFWSSLIFLGLGLLALKYPKAVAMPLGVLAVWFAVSGLIQSWHLYRRETVEKVEDSREVADARTHKHA
jgi:cardiolipin synthase